jgi:hypothetical protein
MAVIGPSQCCVCFHSAFLATLPIQATGFLEHIKLPNYVDAQSELELVRMLRPEAGAGVGGGGGMTSVAAIPASDIAIRVAGPVFVEPCHRAKGRNDKAPHDQRGIATGHQESDNRIIIQNLLHANLQRAAEAASEATDTIEPARFFGS